MAVAWGFAGDCKSAEKYESAAYDLYLNASDFYKQHAGQEWRMKWGGYASTQR